MGIFIAYYFTIGNIRWQDIAFVCGMVIGGMCIINLFTYILKLIREYENESLPENFDIQFRSELSLAGNLVMCTFCIIVIYFMIDGVNNTLPGQMPLFYLSVFLMSIAVIRFSLTVVNMLTSAVKLLCFQGDNVYIKSYTNQVLCIPASEITAIDFVWGEINFGFPMRIVTQDGRTFRLRFIKSAEFCKALQHRNNNINISDRVLHLKIK
jgi:hypothetical protein